MTTKADARVVNHDTNLTEAAGVLGLTHPPFFTKYFTQTIAYAGFGTGHTVSHGLGARPKLFNVWFECIIPEQGYAVGDRVEVTSLTNWFSTFDRGNYNWVSTTQLFWKTLTNNPVIANKSTGAAANTTTANWRVVFEAWA